MSRAERFYKIDRLLQASRCVPLDRMLQELDVSRATFKRDIEYLRSRLHAPIEWDRAERGYKYAESRDFKRQALPGLWFNSSEAYALLMMQALLAEMQPGLLGAHIEPLKARLRAIIEAGQHPASEVECRVRLLNVATRPVSDKNFDYVANALLSRQRLAITYYVRERDESSSREVSPQLLIYYRGNWYLVAWCHQQNAMRSFSMDAIEQPIMTAKSAKAISKRELDGFIGQGYGIFSGTHVRWAKLRFSAERARWVSREQWHPGQRSAFDAEGQLVLEIPYVDVRELSMDILRHGHHVEVLAPAELRQAVLSELSRTLEQYMPTKS
jgi:predicted DNA-binding transcriptional regulator YafY